MYVTTWGLISMGPVIQWVKIEVQAEQGALMRVSGMAFSEAQASHARIRAALKTMGLRWPGKALTLHVHPSPRGETTELDLPLALCVLAVLGQLDAKTIAQCGSVGMIGLNGEVSWAGSHHGLAPWLSNTAWLDGAEAIWPEAGSPESTAESPQSLHAEEVLGPPALRSILTPVPRDMGSLLASAPSEIDSRFRRLHSCHTLPDALQEIKHIEWQLRQQADPTWHSPTVSPKNKVGPTTTSEPSKTPNNAGNQPLGWDLLHGEGHAKRWLAIGAALHIPCMLVGPPGVGKTSLAHAAHALLPPLEPKDQLLVRQRQQLASAQPFAQPFADPDPHGPSSFHRAPMVAPHPAGGAAGLMGAWRKGLPIPGAWALAHRGMLFLDEFTEWPRPAREALRHVMEAKVLHLHRADGAHRWQSDPWIVAATNPCACGMASEQCVCPAHDVDRFRRKLSAPLLERFPIQLEVGGQRDPCNKSWEACHAWVQKIHKHGGPDIGLATSEDGLALMEHLRNTHHVSPRLSQNLHRLAVGHALWRGEDLVQTEDVQEAWNVTWMVRGGWWEHALRSNGDYL